MCLRAATCIVIRTGSVARLDRVILRGLGSTHQRREVPLTSWLFWWNPLRYGSAFLVTPSQFYVPLKRLAVSHAHGRNASAVRLDVGGFPGMLIFIRIRLVWLLSTDVISRSPRVAAA